MKANNTIIQEIIDTTRKLLNEKGSVTIKEITEAAYVNVAAINYYFGEKDALITKVMETVLLELKQSIIDNIIGLPDDFETAINIVIEQIYTFASSNKGILNFLLTQTDKKKDIKQIFVREFIEPNEFTQMVVAKLSYVTNSTDILEVTAKYLLLLSAVATPLMLNLFDGHIDDSSAETLKTMYSKLLVKATLSKIN